MKCRVLTALDIPGPALISSTTEHSTARGPTPSRSPAPSQIPTKPDYSSFSAFNHANTPQHSTTPQPSLFQQQQAAAAARTQTVQTPPVDPFAALSSPMRQATPQQHQPSMFDFANSRSPAAPLAPAADDDDWAFSSALPESQPSSNTLSVSETNLGISLTATREPADPSVITMSLKFSSNVDQPIADLEFMAAVTKVCPVP